MRPTPTLCGLLLVLALSPAVAKARPVAPQVLCDTYPTLADCRGRVASCTTCHTSTWPAAWNIFGTDVLANMGGSSADDAEFGAKLESALTKLESADSDEDGIANLSELEAGTNPGDPESAWPFCANERPPLDAAPVPEGYDFERALTRASILYCGRSPTFEQLETLRSLDDGERYAELHDTVSTCLASSYWRDEGLARLADPRVRPVSSVGAASEVGIVIGDYEWDYRLWSYILTEDRDARELLRADYHVERASDGTLRPVKGKIGATASSGPQPLEPERRAGMITSQWFFAINTMFSPLPRTTAAQAYRAYLGLDLSKQEGIIPMPGEPLDIDDKGVREAQCAGCHAALDPLSYAFAPYEGIVGASLDKLGRSGVYNPRRPAREIPGWNDPQAALLGEPVEDLVQWAEVAAESDAFARNLVSTFFRHALEREPLVSERFAFEALQQSLPGDAYSANRLIHRLVDLAAFGGLAP